MKNKSMFSAWLLFSWLLPFSTLCAQQTFVVRGQIEGLKEGVTVELRERRGLTSVTVAKDTVRNGHFQLQGTAESTKQYEIFCNPKPNLYSWRTLWMAGGDTVSCVGSTWQVLRWNVESSNPLQVEQNVYEEVALQEGLEMSEWRLQGLDLYFKESANSDMDAEEKERIALARKRIRELEDSCSAVMYVKQFNALKSRYWKGEGVEKLSSSARFVLFQMAAFIRYNSGIPSACVEDMKAFCRLIPESQRKTVEMKEVLLFLFPPTSVGVGDAMYDEALLYDLQGNVHRLSDYNKGKYLLLDFWNSGCGNCLAAIPELEEVSALLKDSLVVIGIGSDTKEEWKRVVERHKMKGVQLNDYSLRSGIFAHYGVNGIPHYVIISPEGKIEKVFTGYSKGRIKQKLSSIFPQLLTGK